MNNRFLSSSRLFLPLFVALLPFLAKAQVLINALPPIDSLSDYQVTAFVKQFTAQTAGFEQILLKKMNSTAANMEESWAIFSSAKADSTVSKTELDSLSGVFKTAKRVAKKAKRQHKKATKTLELGTKTAASDNSTQRKNLHKLWKETRQIMDLAFPPEPEEVAKKVEQPQETAPAPSGNEVIDPEASTEEETPELKPYLTQKPPPRTKRYDPREDVMLHPPALPCKMAVNTRDEFSGEIYRRTAAVELFRHTPAVLMSLLGDKPNVLCAAALASSGANAALHLNFVINDPNPRKAFGKIEKGSLITLLFMDGATYFLKSQQNFEGVQNIDTKEFVYQMHFPLSSDVVKKLQREELDKIRITWSSGYEDYDVQYIQLLMQQSKCLFE